MMDINWLLLVLLALIVLVLIGSYRIFKRADNTIWIGNASKMLVPNFSAFYAKGTRYFEMTDNADKMSLIHILEGRVWIAVGTEANADFEVYCTSLAVFFKSLANTLSSASKNISITEFLKSNRAELIQGNRVWRWWSLTSVRSHLKAPGANVD